MDSNRLNNDTIKNTLIEFKYSFIRGKNNTMHPIKSMCRKISTYLNFLTIYITLRTFNFEGNDS